MKDLLEANKFGPFSYVKKSDKYWNPAKGPSIFIKDMDNSYIWNAYNMLKRHEAIIPEVMQIRVDKIIQEYPEWTL